MTSGKKPAQAKEKFESESYVHDRGLLVGLLFISLAETDGKGIHSLKDSISSILKRYLRMKKKRG